MSTGICSLLMESRRGKDDYRTCTRGFSRYRQLSRPVRSSLNCFLKSDSDDQEVWRARIGLDLADRTVLEAEVSISRIVQQTSALTHQCARCWNRN